MVSFFKKHELDELAIFYLEAFISGALAVIMPFTVIYFLDVGLSYLQISIIFAVYGISTFLLEIPTGALADEYSRKVSVIIGFFIMGLASILIPFTNSFFAILICWVFVGLGSTFRSGSDVAWVMDNLKVNKRKKLEKEYFAKWQSILYAGFIVAPLIGSFIVKHFSMDLLWYVFGSGQFIAAFILMVVPEKLKSKNNSVKQAIKNNFKTAKQGFKHIQKSRNLMLIIVSGIFMSIGIMAQDGWTPLMVDFVGFPIESIGYFMSAFAAIMVLIPIISKRFTDEKKVLIITTVFQFLFLAGALILKRGMFVWAVIIFILPELFAGIRHPVKSHLIQKLIPSKIRATTTSIQNMVDVGFGSLFGLIGGYLLDVFPIHLVIGFSSFFIIGVVYSYSKLEIKKK